MELHNPLKSLPFASSTQLVSKPTLVLCVPDPTHIDKLPRKEVGCVECCSSGNSGFFEMAHKRFDHISRLTQTDSQLESVKSMDIASFDLCDLTFFDLEDGGCCLECGMETTRAYEAIEMEQMHWVVKCL
ncbi:unnamed protein product [Albugo candida]|uniref:Uncharacterized protein n=1 Tax=Albugo candida TaxID=65357 RepID=A0A024GSL7_9STRA|nr:unnamed protein product [Albugo candida]|eukprot:CCI49907.1 unnamed protein product [Albugo candida]